MIYITENTDKLGDEFLFSAMNGLSLQRMQKTDSLRIFSDKINSVVVYLMLRYALKKEYDINEKPEFIFGKNQKPYLKDYPQIFFNLSHCRNACTCIVSDKETAADISDFRTISHNTAKYFCSQKELTQACNSEDRNEFLVKLWTKKECLSKLDGSGLYLDYKKICSEDYSNLLLVSNERYFAAYYSEKNTPVVNLTSDELLNL